MMGQGQRFTQQAQESQQQISKILQAGFNVFELQYKDSDKYERTVMGWDTIEIKPHRTPNSRQVQMRATIIHNATLKFLPNEEDILFAYVPDNEKNRRLLAKHIYVSNWFIMRLVTPQGTIPSEQICEEILKLAELLGVTKPLPQKAVERRLKGQGKAESIMKNLSAEEKKELASLLSGTKSAETPKVESTPIAGQSHPASMQMLDPAMTPEPEILPPQKNEKPAAEEVEVVDEAPAGDEAFQKAEAIVHAKQSMLLDYMKKQSPRGWRNTKEYREVILPEIHKQVAEWNDPHLPKVDEPPVTTEENTVTEDPAAVTAGAPGGSPAPVGAGLPDLSANLNA